MNAWLFTLALLAASHSPESSKPKVALWVDGPRSDILQGGLYAGLVNMSELRDADEVKAALFLQGATPKDNRLLDELAWEDDSLARLRKAARDLGVDVLVLTRSQQRGPRHLTVSLLVISASERAPLATEVWTLVGRGGRAATATYNFRRIQRAVTQAVTLAKSQVEVASR